jgi:hypothetical protein
LKTRLGNAGQGVQNGYDSGVLLSTCRFGAGTFTVSTLRILQHLDTHPAADRLLLNMIRHASSLAKPAAVPLPADFDTQLKSLLASELTGDAAVGLGAGELFGQEHVIKPLAAGGEAVHRTRSRGQAIWCDVFQVSAPCFCCPSSSRHADPR